jgi:hypothetical protein
MPNKSKEKTWLDALKTCIKESSLTTRRDEGVFET